MTDFTPITPAPFLVLDSKGNGKVTLNGTDKEIVVSGDVTLQNPGGRTLQVYSGEIFTIASGANLVLPSGTLKGDGGTKAMNGGHLNSKGGTIAVEGTLTINAYSQLDGYQIFKDGASSGLIIVKPNGAVVNTGTWPNIGGKNLVLFPEWEVNNYHQLAAGLWGTHGANSTDPTGDLYVDFGTGTITFPANMVGGTVSSGSISKFETARLHIGSVGIPETWGSASH